MLTCRRHCEFLWETVENIGLGKQIVVVSARRCWPFAEGRDYNKI